MSHPGRGGRYPSASDVVSDVVSLPSQHAPACLVQAIVTACSLCQPGPSLQRVVSDVGS